MLNEIGVVRHLRELGLTEDMLDGIVEGAFNMKDGCRVLDIGEIHQILEGSTWCVLPHE